MLRYIASQPGWLYPRAGDPMPLGNKKCLLLTEGGVCIVGDWGTGQRLLAWSPMPKRDKSKEARMHQSSFTNPKEIK